VKFILDASSTPLTTITVPVGGVYSFAWNTTGAAAGNHNITAIATDNGGRTTTSSPPVVITITPFVNPTALIT
jgi:hypothetical protein